MWQNAPMVLGRLAAALALFVALSGPEIGDLPGTSGSWQQGTITLETSPEKVHSWLTDYAHWPQRFDDVESAQEEPTLPDGRRVVRFRSRVLDRVMTIRIRESARVIVFEGEGPNLSIQGRIYIDPLGPQVTRVVMQNAAELHGGLRIVASSAAKRERQRGKLRADLSSLEKLAKRRD
jgi:hypothetical protein